RPYASERERARALEEYLRYYNHERPHSACGGDVPMSRIRQQRDGS
ncbi:MAG: integrase core domain-containing protein, partial [Atopobiaceae bacterium]|nr:integrase core domain-containing protein [Atopobiaceae bacterium]MBR2683381.1 integrase core domain-containing protein [Atopobiaceae bacterium]